MSRFESRQIGTEQQPETAKVVKTSSQMTEFGELTLSGLKGVIQISNLSTTLWLIDFFG